MKLILFLLLVANSVIAQEIALSEKEVLDQICRTWKINYSMTAGKVNTVFPKLRQYELHFKPDYTFVLITSSGTTPGSWCYNTKRNCIELFYDNHYDLQITSLNKFELKMALSRDAVDGSLNWVKNHSQYVPK
jgi:hypothetical protein